jgi:hypothetical protein
MSTNHTSGNGGNGAIVVGARDVDPRLPSHISGVRQGNWPDKADRVNEATASTRSTGINANDRLPIDPQMPRLPPA